MKALIVDDELSIQRVLRLLLAENGFEVKKAGTLSDARTLMANNLFDVAFIDLRLPDGSGMDALKELKNLQPGSAVLIITAFATTDTAIRAMKMGAYDYVIKPFNLDELRVALKNIKEKILLQKKVKELQKYADRYQYIVGKSDAMKNVFSMIEKIAPFETSVILVGETGTGKELVARAIHAASRRVDNPFLAINCASLPGELLESELFGYMKGAFTGAYTSRRGLLEESHGGTLLLDEISEMPQSLQAKLLRFLEDKKIRPIGSSNEIIVDVRIIAATNINPVELVEKGNFRADLYYRLSAFEIRLPSLRDRRDDIPLLITHFVQFFSEKFQIKIHSIDPLFVHYILNNDLKGNVRELKNIIEREIILSDDGVLRLRSVERASQQENSSLTLPEQGINLDEYLSIIEKTMLHNALERANGVKTKAAELLGLTFREFRYRLSKHSTQ